MSAPAFEVRPATRDDAREMARQAIEVVTWSPLCKLGPGFMAMIYRHMVSGPHGFGHVAEVEGRFAGFFVGSFDTKAYYRDFLRRCAFEAAGRVLLRIWHPLTWKTVWRALTFFRAAHDDDPPADVLGIVIDESLGVRGMGRALFEAGLQTWRDHEVRFVGIPDVDVRNEKATGFFERMGAVCHRTEPAHDGNEVCMFRLEIPA